MNDDAIAKFKEGQRQGWKHFVPLEMMTTPVAARLVKFARVRDGHRLLDVACGTGVVAVTAARTGAHVTGLDLTPELLPEPHRADRRPDAQGGRIADHVRSRAAGAVPRGIRRVGRPVFRERPRPTGLWFTRAVKV